jgi:tetratricopeptide (TPR) repeat protein
MHGNLETTSLADILLHLHLTRRSGILRLIKSDIRKSVYFLDGSIVFAHSNQKHDRLGETLLRLGKITLEEFELASRDVIEKGKRLGQALSDLGFISVQEIGSSVHYQLRQITQSLFDWDSGRFEFVERERPVFEDIMIDVSTPSLMLDGIRNISNPVVLERMYGKDGSQILKLNPGVPRLPRTELDFGEETILACVDGQKTIDAVRQLSHLSSLEFDRALGSLLFCGMLEIDSGVKVSENKESVNPDKQRVSFTTRPMDFPQAQKEPEKMKTLSEQDIRRLISVTCQKFQDATDEEVLNVLPDCTLQEIDNSYENFMSQFHPPYYSQDRFLDVKDALKSILDRLTEAHDNLIAKFHSQKPLHETPLIPLRGETVSAPGLLKPLQFPPDPPAPPAVRQEKPISSDPQKEPISELKERILKDPGNTTLLRRLGRRLSETGKPHEGEKQLLRALELEPQSIDNHFALADLYNSLGLKIKAFKHLNIILQLQPNNERAMDLLNLKKTRKPLYEIEH